MHQGPLFAASVILLALSAVFMLAAASAWVKASDDRGSFRRAAMTTAVALYSLAALAVVGLLALVI